VVGCRISLGSRPGLNPPAFRPRFIIQEGNMCSGRVGKGKISHQIRISLSAICRNVTTRIKGRTGAGFIGRTAEGQCNSPLFAFNAKVSDLGCA